MGSFVGYGGCTERRCTVTTTIVLYASCTQSRYRCNLEKWGNTKRKHTARGEGERNKESKWRRIKRGRGGCSDNAASAKKKKKKKKMTRNQLYIAEYRPQFKVKIDRTLLLRFFLKVKRTKGEIRLESGRGRGNNNRLSAVLDSVIEKE